MIERWFEPFTLLKKRETPDDLGGVNATYTPTLTFQGALSYTAGTETNAAGQFVLEENPVLLHEFDVTLTLGDYVRRDRTGMVYRVGGHSGNLRSPAFSGLRFAQVPVKKVVIPC